MRTRRKPLEQLYLNMRGEKASSARLTTEQVLEIRRLHRERLATIGAMAARFGVAHRTIQAVIYRHSWRHLP